MSRARAYSGSERAALLRRVRSLIAKGFMPEAIAPELGVSKQHAYRLVASAGVTKYLLTPDEARYIEARRTSLVIHP